MPRLNGRGQAVMGVGGAVSVDGVVYAQRGTCASWLDDDALICQTPDTGAWQVSVARLGVPGVWQAVDARGCNFLAAGGGRWQAQLVGVDCFGSYGSRPTASLGLLDNDGRGYAGPGGEIDIIPAGGVGIDIYSDLGVTSVGGVIARDVQVLGPTRAIWRDDAGRFHTIGIQTPIQAGPGIVPRYAIFQFRTSWVVYFSGTYGLIAHPVDSLEGVVLAPPGHAAFYHDARVVDERLVVAWSSGAGELPHELVIEPDALALPRVTFGAPPALEVPPMGKRCWVTWFEFIPPPLPILPPGNGAMWVRDGGIFRATDGRVIGTWCAGETPPATVTVEGIEAQCETAPHPVAYWDGRTWPRWPQSARLEAEGWLALQAYCRRDETPAAFEQDLRRILASVPPSFARIALVAQCYTSNASLTTDLASLVPVYSRLCRDDPRVTLLAPFSDQGRATGLQDHPEVRGLWEQLVAGVTGEPEGESPMPTPPPNNGIDAAGVLVDPKNYFLSLVWDKPPAEFARVFRAIQQDLWKYGIGFQTRSDGTPTSRVYLPTAICPSAGAVTPQDKFLGVRQDPQCFGDEFAWAGADTVENDAEGFPIAWTWQPRGSGTYQPVPAPDPPPPSGDVAVLVLDYDRTTRRSDPKGCLVRFEAASPRPIVKVTLDLEGDVAPPIATTFAVGPGFDGRYVRALAFKPTENGTFPLRVTAWDDLGRVGQSDGSHTVTVVP